jgi:hypothetical protein
VPLTAVADQLASGVAPHLASPLSTITVTVTNTGAVASDYAALLFLVPPAPGVDGAPLQYLAGFDRVHLAPGQTQVRGGGCGGRGGGGGSLEEGSCTSEHVSMGRGCGDCLGCQVCLMGFRRVLHVMYA